MAWVKTGGGGGAVGGGGGGFLWEFWSVLWICLCFEVEHGDFSVLFSVRTCQGATLVQYFAPWFTR